MKQIFAALVAIFAFAIPALANLSPETVSGATTVSVEDAANLFDEGVVFIDVRKPSDYEAGRVPGAVHLDVKTAFSAESLAAVIAMDEKVVIYCNGHSCMRSSKATAMAVEWGYSHVYYMRDGFPAWDVSGMPVE